MHAWLSDFISNAILLTKALFSSKGYTVLLTKYVEGHCIQSLQNQEYNKIFLSKVAILLNS